MAPTAPGHAAPADPEKGHGAVYAEAICGDDNDDVYYHGSEDEDYDSPDTRRRRYEAAAQRFLAGHVPFLLSASLRGPFDQQSGWANPWHSRQRVKNSKPGGAAMPQIEEPSARAQGPAEPLDRNPVGDSLDCHLPSPESLKQAPVTGPHPHLEQDELSVIQSWRNGVQLPSLSSREPFWAPCETRTASSGKKRRAKESAWLKRVTTKKKRKIDSSDVSFSPSPLGRRTSNPRVVPIPELRGSTASARRPARPGPQSGAKAMSFETQTSDMDELTALSPNNSFGSTQTHLAATPKRISPRRDVWKSVVQAAGPEDDELNQNEAAAATLSSPMSLKNKPKAPLDEPVGRARATAAASIGLQTSPRHEALPADQADSASTDEDVEMADSVDASAEEQDVDIASEAEPATQLDQSFCFKMRHKPGEGAEASPAEPIPEGSPQRYAAGSSSQVKPAIQELRGLDVGKCPDRGLAQHVRAAAGEEGLAETLSNETILEGHREEPTQHARRERLTGDERIETIETSGRLSKHPVEELQIAGASANGPKGDEGEAVDMEGPVKNAAELDGHKRVVEPTAQTAPGMTERDQAWHSIHMQTTAERGFNRECLEPIEAAVPAKQRPETNMDSVSSDKPGAEERWPQATEPPRAPETRNIATLLPPGTLHPASLGGGPGPEADADAARQPEAGCEDEAESPSLTSPSARAAQQEACAAPPFAPARDADPSDAAAETASGAPRQGQGHCTAAEERCEASAETCPQQATKESGDFSLSRILQRLIPSSPWARLSQLAPRPAEADADSETEDAVDGMADDGASRAGPWAEEDGRAEAASEPAAAGAPRSTAGERAEGERGEQQPWHGELSGPEEAPAQAAKAAVDGAGAADDEMESESTGGGIGGVEAQTNTGEKPPDGLVSESQQSPWVEGHLCLPAQPRSAGGSNEQLQGEPGRAEESQAWVPPELQSPWAKGVSDVAQAPGAGDGVETEAAAAAATPCRARPSTPEPQFTVKSFASFMTPSPERQRAEDGLAGRRGAAGQPAPALKMPGRGARACRRVSWRLPDEQQQDGGGGGGGEDADAALPRRAASPPPPPATPTDGLTTPGSGKFRTHFAAVARRARAPGRRLIPTASQQLAQSPGLQGMAETFLAADGKAAARDEDGDEGGGGGGGGGGETAEAHGGSGGTDRASQQSAMDVVDDMLCEMDDLLRVWDVDAELDRARREARSGCCA